MAENVTSVLIYLPQDRFCDFATLAPVEGAPGVGISVRTATGALYVYDSVSMITQKETTSAQLAYAESRMTVSDSFELIVFVVFASVCFLGR